MQKAISKYWPVFVLPTLIAFIIGFIWPFIWGIYLSFQRFTTVSKTTFVGIQNYINVFQDSTFLHAFGFTAAFTVVSTVLINVCAFAIALVLTRGIKGTNLFRTVFFMPNLIGGILLGYIWQILLNGVLANLQKPLLALDARYGFIGLVILMCWQQIGYMWPACRASPATSSKPPRSTVPTTGRSCSRSSSPWSCPALPSARSSP